MSMEKRMGPSESNFEKRREQSQRHKKLLPGEDETPLPPPVEPIKSDGKQKRNEPCACGSGKKFKVCCGKE